MATVTTYLLVSNPKDPGAIRSHPIVDEHDFDVQSSGETQDGLPVLTLVTSGDLEGYPDLEGPCRELSAEYPEATITFCEVEERFGQVEHLRSVIFIDGKHAGEIEHGYVLNVGT